MSQALDQLNSPVLDEEDLEVVSTHLQDAVVKVAECALAAQRKPPCRRAQSLRLGKRQVTGRNTVAAARPCASSASSPAKCRSLDPAGKDAVLNLLASNSPRRQPVRHRVAHIFRGAVLRLDVECLEAELADLGPVWTAATCPKHADAEKA